MRFEGTKAYVATDDLKVAVNAAITLERPLLVKGEPGTGKTVLALEIAKAIGAPLIEWHVKSTTKALQGLYEYDAVSRLRDSQLGDARVQDIRNYIKRGKLWDAFVADERPVLLIDEIDKADIEFPNDLLLELDRMEFFVYETGETVKARRRPIVIITSNNEKELPDAFLRRCFFHYIRFPDPDTMTAIIEVHFPGIKQRLVSEALKLFYEIRDVPGMKKKPSTSELLDWLKLLMVEDIGPEILRERDPKKLIPPLHGALHQERAGRASVRAAGVYGAARGALSAHCRPRESGTHLAIACGTAAGSRPRASRRRTTRVFNRRRLRPASCAGLGAGFGSGNFTRCFRLPPRRPPASPASPAPWHRRRSCRPRRGRSGAPALPHRGKASPAAAFSAVSDRGDRRVAGRRLLSGRRACRRPWHPR